MLLKWRKKKIAENAREHLEPGEEIRAMVMTQTGQTAMGTAVAGQRHGAAGAAGGEFQAGREQAEAGQVSGGAAARADEKTALGRVHALAGAGSPAATA